MVLSFCSRPPITKLWPSRSSTVVVARRTISGGTEMPVPATWTGWLVSSWLTSGSIFRLIRPSLQHGRREGEADAVALVVDGHGAERARDRDRELAAGEEARGVAGQRHQVGLGQAAGEALLLERVDGDVDRKAAAIERAEQEPEGRAGLAQHAGGRDRRRSAWPRVGAVGSERWCGAVAGCRYWRCVFCPKLFHCTPSSRLACREASTKRTSSITCWACSTVTVLIGSGANWRAMTIAWSSVCGVARGAREHDAAVDRGDLDAAVAEVADLGRQAGDVVGHLDVEDADLHLALAVERDPGGADLLAENGERAIGQRRDVGDVGIPDGDVGEGGVDAHVLGLADRDRDRDRVLGAADLQQPLRLRGRAASRGDSSNADVASPSSASEASSRNRFLPASVGPPPRVPAPARNAAATAAAPSRSRISQ